MKSRGTSRFVKRILLCGLDESGRSSIRKMAIKGRETRRMEDNGAVLSYFQWHLTKEPDSPTITILELGGRWSALEKFILNLSSSAFFGIQALLFVVDISEENTYDTALRYYKLVLQRIQDYSPSARIFVFLNKIDLSSSSNKKQKRVKQLKERFQNQVEDAIGFYETTIHDNSANEAFLAVLGEIMPDAEKQIGARLEELSMISTQEAKMITMDNEPPRPGEKALELEIEPEKTQSEIIPPVDGPFSDIPIPSIPNPPMNLETTPSIEDRVDLATQTEHTKIKEPYELKELREVLDQTRETLHLSAISLLTLDGKHVIKLGEDLEQFDETIIIAQRAFESAAKHVPEGLEQLIIELIDSNVAITKVNEMYLLITRGAPSFNLEDSHKFVEFARQLATNTQKIR